LIAARNAARRIVGLIITKVERSLNEALSPGLLGRQLFLADGPLDTDEGHDPGEVIGRGGASGAASVDPQPKRRF
jgi:hypothetical protein